MLQTLFFVYFKIFSSKSDQDCIQSKSGSIIKRLTFLDERLKVGDVKLENNGCNISSMRCSVSSLDETPRRELKIRRAASIFDELRGVSSDDETLCGMPDIASQTK